MSARSHHSCRVFSACFAAFFLLNTLTIHLPAGQYRSAARRPFRHVNHTVVLVADVHADPAAQNEIKSIFLKLHDKIGISLFGLEGAFDAIDTTLFTSCPSPSLIREAADILLQEGRLSGAEWAALARPSIRLIGIEDKTLYSRALNILSDVFRKEEHVQQHTSKLESILTVLENNNLSPPLLKRLRKPLDFTGLHNDSSAPLELSSLLYNAEIKRRRALVSLTKTKNEKQILFLGQQVRLLIRLCRGEMTRSDLLFYQNMPQRLDLRGAGQHKEIIACALNALKSQREKMALFYRLAQAREKAMAKGLADMSKKTRASAALVGGFHIDGIRQRLSARKTHVFAAYPTTFSSPPGRPLYKNIIRGYLSPPVLLANERGRKDFLRQIMSQWTARWSGSNFSLYISKRNAFIKKWASSYKRLTNKPFPFQFLWNDPVPPPIIEKNKPDITRQDARQAAKTAQRLILIQWLSGLSFHTAFSTIHLMNAGYSLTFIAQISAVFSPAYMASSLLLGKAASLWGKKKVLIISLAANTVGTFALALASVFPLMPVLWAVSGALAMAGYTVTMSGLLYDALERMGRADSFKKVYGVSLQRLWMALAFSSLLGGFAIEWIPAKEVIMISGLIYAGLAMGAARAVQEVRAIGPAPKHKKSACHKSMWETGKKIFFVSGLGLFVGFCLLASSIAFTLTDFLTQPLMEESHVPLTFFGAVYFVVNLLQSFAARLADRTKALVLSKFPRTIYLGLTTAFLGAYVMTRHIVPLLIFLGMANFWQSLLAVISPDLIMKELDKQSRPLWFSVWSVMSTALSMASLWMLSIGLRTAAASTLLLLCFLLILGLSCALRLKVGYSSKESTKK